MKVGAFVTNNPAFKVTKTLLYDVKYDFISPTLSSVDLISRDLT